MLNPECKHCHKKWHQDSAKYCSWCGNKLVDEPEFKSGDVVASRVFSGGSFGLVRLNEDLTNRFALVYGFWYTKRDCDIVGVSLGVLKEGTRHATPTEIAEYEAALQFHKHGREPFEVKEGDLMVRTQNKHKLFVEDIKNWDKLDFTSGNYELIATVEELDKLELGADDDK